MPNMPIKFPDGNGDIMLIGPDSYFEEEVSLYGGVRVWNRIQLEQSVSLWGNHNYLDFDNSTINANSNLHYTGNHVFDDKITLKSGLHTADSMRSDFGDYGSIKATFDTINVSHSTITGNATITGKQTFGAEVTLQGSAEFQDDIAVADSLNVDFGSHSKILAQHDTINVAGSTILGDHSVNGNTYFEQKQHFLDPIIAHDGVSLIGELTGADSLNHNFGRDCTIAARYDTIDLRNSYVRFDGATLSGYSLGGGDYTLPTASNLVKGGIKVGNGLRMSDDILNVNFDFSNQHIYGTAMSLEAASAYFGISQSTIAGVLHFKDNVVFENGATGFDLPTASTSVKGGIKVGNGLSMSGDTLNVTLTSGGGDYSLPTASNSTKGGIKIGNGLIMQGDTLHAVQSTTVILDTVPSTVEGAMWYVL